MKEELAKAFFERAKEDLESAEILFKNKKYTDCIFHCEQAVQKSLKSVLILFGIEVYEHRVSHIFKDEVAIKYPELEEISKVASEIEDHWLKTRYPIKTKDKIFNPLKYYNEKIAKEILEKAKKVLSEIEKFLKENFGLFY